MKKLKVIFHETFTERDVVEMPDRGYASHILIESEDGKKYPVYFIDPVRLQQEMKDNEAVGDAFFAEPGLIVLPKVTVEAIQNAVDLLWQQGFFEHLHPQH